MELLFEKSGWHHSPPQLLFMDQLVPIRVIFLYFGELVAEVREQWLFMYIQSRRLASEIGYTHALILSVHAGNICTLSLEALQEVDS